MAKSKREYLNNKNLKMELQKSHDKGELTAEACNMLYLLIEKIQGTLFYKRQTSKEDCAGYAMYIICKVWHKFDMNLNNPFSWFTSVVVNALKQGWNKHEDQPILISLDTFINNDTDQVE